MTTVGRNFFVKLTALFKRLFKGKSKKRKSKRKSRLFRPKRRRKIAPRKIKKRIVRKPSSKKHSSKVKTSSTQKSRTSVRKQKNSALQVSKVFSPDITKGSLIGEITHFFPRIQVCVLKVSTNGIKVGEQISIVGKESQFTQEITSLQIESVNVKAAHRGDLVGLKLDKPAKVGDKIFKV